MVKPVKISIAICTRNRPKSLLLLLQSLRRHHNQPDSIFIVDDITDGQKITASNITNTIGNIPLHYHPVKFNSICHSRNFVLKHVSENIILFMDDDTEVKTNIVSRVRINHQTQPHICVFCPTIKSTDNRSLSLVIAALTNCGYDKQPSYSPQLSTPSGACFSLNRHLIRKHHITFPRHLQHIGEDSVFFYKIYKAKLKIIHDSKMVIYHHFDIRNTRQTLHRFYIYGQGYNNINKFYSHLLPHDLSWIFPGRILDYLLFPIFFLNVVLKKTQLSIHDSQISSRFYLYIFLINFSYILGVYSQYHLFDHFSKQITSKLLEKH